MASPLAVGGNRFAGRDDQTRESKAQAQRAGTGVGVTAHAQLPRGDVQFAGRGRRIAGDQMVRVVHVDDGASPAEIRQRNHPAAKLREPPASIGLVVRQPVLVTKAAHRVAQRIARMPHGLTALVGDLDTLDATGR